MGSQGLGIALARIAEGMFKTALQIGHVRGVPVRLHFTLALVIPYLAFELARGARAVAAQAEIPLVASSGLLFAWGFLLAVAIFVSIFLHELAHVVVAQRAGGKVRAITLMLLGGVSEIERMPSGGPEAKMAIVGPLASLWLGLLGLLAFFAVGATTPLLRLFLYYLAITNLVIGLFNLLPAFPLDGGRVLRALLRNKIGQVRATTIAAAVSKVVAVAMLVFGLLTKNLVLSLIAFFLFVAGDAEARDTVVREALRGMKVGDLARREIPVLSKHDTIEEARLALARSGAQAVAIVDGAEPPSTLTLLELVRACNGATAGPTTQLGLLRGRTCDVVKEDDDIGSALDAMNRRAGEHVLVLGDDGAMRILRRDDVARAVQLSGLFRKPARSPRSGV